MSTTSRRRGRLGRSVISSSAASTTSTATCDAVARGEAAGATGQARAGGRLGRRAAGRARRGARAVSVGLPARLRALDRRPRGRPGAGDLGGLTGRGGVALYFAALASSPRRATSTSSRTPTSPSSSASGPAADRVPARSTGVALEISTAGLHKPVGEVYPDLPMLAAHPPITLASDAHVPQDVGRDFDRALEHARTAGYETVTVFEGASGTARAARDERVPRRQRLRRARARGGRAARPRRRPAREPAGARRPLGRRRDHPRADRRAARRGEPRRHRLAVPVRSGTHAAGDLLARPARAGLRARPRAGLGARQTPTASSSARSRASRRSGTRCARRSPRRSPSTRNGSPSGRRRPTSSASQVGAKDSQLRRSRCFAARADQRERGLLDLGLRQRARVPTRRRAG